MTVRKLSRRRFLLILMLLAGVVTAGLGYSINNLNKPKPLVGFTMVSTQTFTPSDGSKPILYAVKVRYQKSDGNWKLVTTYYNRDGKIQKIETGIGELGHGVFKIDEEKQTRNFISPMVRAANSPARRSPQALRNAKHFLREDVVLGYKTFVLSIPDDPEEYGEIYLAPELLGLAIKKVFISKGGVDTTEAIKIDLGEPSEEVFNSTPNYSVSYDHFKEKINMIEQTGDKGAADYLRQVLNSVQSKRE